MSSVIVASPVNSVIDAFPVNSVVNAEDISVVISVKFLISIAFDGSSIPDFDDNGAAIAGGLNSGELYRTPSNKINVVKSSNILLDFGDKISLFWRAFW